MNTNYNAKIIAHSISPDGITLITMEIEYPRFIHSELMTHRILSKNAASSRAIPIEAMHAHIISNTAQPIYWGANQAGMQASKEIEDIPAAIRIWMRARNYAIACAKRLSKLNSHKQNANRITEPFMVMKTIISGTEWGNLFHLRDHEAAQPEFRYLVRLMRNALKESKPILLRKGEWHLPYVNSVRNENGIMIYLAPSGEQLSLEDARKISAACCAQVSYRKLDDTLEKCRNIYSKLIESEPPHCSPVEHQGTPIDILSNMYQEGVTHITKDGMLWSGNFRGWIQFRKTIPNECVW